MTERWMRTLRKNIARRVWQAGSNTFRLYSNKSEIRTLPEIFRQSPCFHDCFRRKEIASWTVEKVLQCVQSH